MFFTALQVAAGGAIGATLRYLFGMGVPRLLGQHSLPLSILLTNIIGSTLMGLLVSFLGIKGLTQWNAFLGVGVLGGFTTFSSFSLETWTLVERGEPMLAAVYVVLSVAVSLAGLFLGMTLMRGVLA